LWWSDDNNGSGFGSTINNTYNLRNSLSSFIIQKNISSIIDTSCGSCMWTSKWFQELQYINKKINYYGIDISLKAVNRCKINFNYLNYYHNIKIDTYDINNFSYKSELLLNRDTLQHLSYKNIFKTLENFSNSRIEWYIIGSYKEIDNNINIKNGDYFLINLSKYPFLLIPDEILNDTNIYGEVKSLFVFEGENFRKQIKKMIFKIEV
jgi:hypothetical protein